MERVYVVSKGVDYQEGEVLAIHGSNQGALGTVAQQGNSWVFHHQEPGLVIWRNGNGCWLEIRCRKVQS